MHIYVIIDIPPRDGCQTSFTESKVMSRANIEKSKQKILLIIIITIIIASFVFFMGYEYLVKRENTTRRANSIDEKNMSFAMYIKEGKKDIELIAHYLEEVYNDATLQQRNFLREKKMAILQYIGERQKSILYFTTNPFFAAVCQNLVEGFLQNGTKSGLWQKYNNYSDNLVDFAEQNHLAHFYILSENSDVVWCLDKTNPLFQKKLNSPEFQNNDVSIAWQGQVNSTTTTTLYQNNSLLVSASIRSENKKSTVLVWKINLAPLENLLLSNKPNNISDIFLQQQQQLLTTPLVHNSDYAFLANIPIEKDNHSFAFENFQHTTSIGFFTKIKNNWGLVATQNFKNIFINKVTLIEKLQQKNKYIHYHIFYSKARKLLCSTQIDSFIEQGKIQQMIRKKLHNNSFAMSIDKNEYLGNIYLLQKVLLSEDFPMFVVAEIPKSKLCDSWGYGKDILLYENTSREQKNFDIFGVKFVNQVSAEEKNSLFIFFSVIVTIFIVIFLYFFIKAELNDIHTVSENKRSDKEQKLTSLVNFSDLLEKSYDKTVFQRKIMNELETEISKHLVIHQEISNILSSLDRSFSKFIQLAEKNQATTKEIRNIFEEVNYNRLEMTDIAMKIRHFNGAVNVLSLNASVEASNQKEKTTFSTLATEYQKITREMDTFLNGIVKNIKNNTAKMITLTSLSSEEINFSVETIDSVKQKYKNLQHIQNKYSKQKNTLQHLHFLLNEVISSNLETRENIEEISQMLHQIIQNEKNMAGLNYE